MSNGFEVRPHWLQFSIPNARPEKVEADLREFVSGEFVPVEGGFAGYESQKVSGKVRLLWSSRRPEVHVVFSGEACDEAGGARMQGLLAYVSENGQVSRCDVAGDDFERVVSPEDVREAVKARLCFTHSECWRWYENNKGGTTFTMGSPSSRQQLRVYDKASESDGLTPSTRWELQTRDEAAQTLVEQLSRDPWGDVFASRLVQFVDFRDRCDETRVMGCERSGWFQSLVGQAKKALAYFPKPPRTVAEVDAWFRKQCAPMVAVLVDVSGGSWDWFHDVLSEGRQRWRGRHLALLAAA